MKILLAVILLFTSIRCFSQATIPYKYIFIIKSQTAFYYRDTASYSTGVSHTGDVFVGERIVNNYAEIRKPAWEGGETKGWMHITDLTIWKHQIISEKSKNPMVMADNKYIREAFGTEDTENSDVVEPERSDLEKYLLGSETELPGTAISNLEIADTILSTPNEMAHIKSDKKETSFEKMSNEAGHKEIDKLSKEEGSRIYWNAMARNIMVMVLIAAVVLLLKALNREKKS